MNLIISKKNILSLAILLVFLTGCFGTKEQPVDLETESNINKSGIPEVKDKDLTTDSIDFLDNLTDTDVAILEKPENISFLNKLQKLCDISKKQDCLDSVKMEQAMLLDNSFFCNQLSTYKDKCYERFALREKDIKLCDSILNSNKKSSCSDTLTNTQAVEDNNINLCNNITSDSKKDACISSLIRRNDLDFCQNQFITSNNLEDKCLSLNYTKQAWQNNDPALCEQVPLESYKQTCLDEMQ